MTAISAALVLSIGGLFAIDLVVPLGIACTAPYAAVIVLTLWLPSRKYIVVTALVVSVLITLGLFLSPGDQLWRSVVNRLFSLLAVWVVAIAALQRKRLLARIAADQRRRKHSEKLEVIGRLGAGIAHDVNNLMTVVVGHIELMWEHLGPGHPAREDLNEIRKASQRCTALTQQLLAFTRRKASPPRLLDLNETIREMESLLRRLTGEDVEWTLRLQPGLGRIRADRGQIEQIILNLVLNARDAMPTGGKLCVETANAEPGEPFHESMQAADARWITLAVSDTGAGIDKETLARIFEPLFTTKEDEKGTGLGLATVRDVVEAAGGRIEVSSEPKRGTTFRIHFPRAGGPGATGAESESPGDTSSSPAGSETILLVEDHAQVRALAHKILSNKGYVVLSVADGQEALSVSESRHHGFDLLLTDVALPGMSGPQVAKRLRELNPALKVLYISAHPSETLTERGLLDTEFEFLQKPFTPETLLGKVRQVLAPKPSKDKPARET